MNFAYSKKSIALQQKLTAFIEQYILPIENDYIAFHADKNNMWLRFPEIEILKEKAKEADRKSVV